MSQTNPYIDSSTQDQQRPKRSPAEWTTFSIATLILAVLIGLVLYAWFTKKDQPPVLSVTPIDAARTAPGQFYVPFEVTNTGGETAETIRVIAELEVNGEVVEDGEQEIDFLAKGEKEEGAFVFSRNPREGELTLRVAGYKLP